MVVTRSAEIYAALNLGSTKLAVSKSSTVGGSENLSSRYARISDFMVLVSVTSSSFSASTREWRMCRTGFTDEMVTYSSPDRASVNSTNGARALLTASKTSRSDHVGTRCLDALSSVRTCNNNYLLF